MNRKAQLLLVVAVIGLAKSATAQKESKSEIQRPYRWAVGMNALFPEWDGGVAMSVSKDLLSRFRRFSVRADVSVIGGRVRQSGASATVDAVYGIPTFGRTLYGLGGVGVSLNEGHELVIGGGVDFDLRNRPMFIETRGYASIGNYMLRLGVRY